MIQHKSELRLCSSTAKIFLGFDSFAQPFLGNRTRRLLQRFSNCTYQFVLLLKSIRQCLKKVTISIKVYVQLKSNLFKIRQT